MKFYRVALTLKSLLSSSSSLNSIAYLDLDNFDQYARVRVNLWIIADEIFYIVSAYLLSFGYLTKITFEGKSHHFLLSWYKL